MPIQDILWARLTTTVWSLSNRLLCWLVLVCHFFIDVSSYESQIFQLDLPVFKSSFYLRDITCKKLLWHLHWMFEIAWEYGTWASKNIEYFQCLWKHWSKSCLLWTGFLLLAVEFPCYLCLQGHHQAARMEGYVKVPAVAVPKDFKVGTFHL